MLKQAHRSLEDEGRQQSAMKCDGNREHILLEKCNVYIKLVLMTSEASAGRARFHLVRRQNMRVR